MLGAVTVAQAQQGLPTGAVQPAPAEFTDLHPDRWAADAIARLTALGVLTGYRTVLSVAVAPPPVTSWRW